MAGLRLDGVGYRYPSGGAPALHGVDLAVEAGEIVLLAGPTGCGKSTLLRVAAGLLGRHGQGSQWGRVHVDGVDLAGLPARERARRVAFVGQNPERQIVAGTLGEEVAFGLRQTGWPLAEMPARVAHLLATVGLEQGPGARTDRLSGGERQRLVVAAALASGASVLLLDEPLAHLDPKAAERLLHLLSGLALSGTAILLVEHRLSQCLPRAQRVAVLHGGRIVAEGRAASFDDVRLRELDLAPPRRPAQRPADAVTADVLLQARGGTLSWPGAPRPAVSGVDLEVRRGERVAVVGGNGAGKSTLLAGLAGRMPGAGFRQLGRVVRVPQDPDLSLFCETVQGDLAYAAQEEGLASSAVGERVGLAARAMAVEPLLDRAPQALSRGQRLRVAVAAALAADPAVLMLDEPTAGQDPAHVERMMEALAARPASTLIFATHDLALASRWATRVVVLDRGRVVGDGPPDSVLAPGVLPPPLRPEGADGAAGVEPATTPLPGDSPAVTGAEPIDARLRLLLLACVSVLAITLERPSSLTALAILAAVPLPWSGLGRAWWWRGAPAVLAVVWGTVLSQALFYDALPRVPLLVAGPVTFWREGALWGLVQSLRFVAPLLAGVAVAVSTPPDRFHAALRDLGLAPRLSFLLVTALRTIPDTARTLLVVREARAERGLPVWRRGPGAWVRLELSLLRPVIAESLRRARALAEALDARGFDASDTPAFEAPPAIPVRDRVIIGLAGTLTLGAVVLRLAFLLYVSELLFIPALRPVYGFVRFWL